MGQDHYRILGVSRNATAAEIKSAYRKLVLVHHPDKSTSAQSSELFLKITDAYNVLSDIDRRRTYDRSISNEARRPVQQPVAQPQQQAPRVAPEVAVAGDVTKLTVIFTRGQYAEAERLARSILQRDQKQSIPYAVLGDLARARGQLAEAAKMFAYAAQMDPRNPVYQQRHEELLRATQQASNPVDIARNSQRNTLTVVVGGLMVVSACLYIAISGKEPLIAPAIGIVSTWTLGLCVMLFLIGVSTGSVLSSTNLIDRFNASAVASTGRIASPIVALTTVAIVNFWAAALLFLGLSASQKGYAMSHVRFIGGIAAATLLMVFASSISRSNAFSPGQVFLWGGNLTYLGGICGWMVSDSFKRI